jgi:hypothetical protein
MVVADRVDVRFAVALCSEFVADELAERQVVKRREHWPLVVWRIKDTLVDSKEMDNRRGNRGIISLLFLAEHGHRLRVEINVAPPESGTAFIVRVAPVGH